MALLRLIFFNILKAALQFVERINFLANLTFARFMKVTSGNSKNDLNAMNVLISRK
jgi:hypothetical protein